jgi:hypothetical protein
MSKRQRAADNPDAPPIPEITNSVALMYPDGGPREDHYFDPYQPMASGAVDVTPATPKKKKSKAPVAIDESHIAETRVRRARYDRFIDELIAAGGDKLAALSKTYGVPSHELAPKINDYLADVMLGMSTSSVADMLEVAGIGKQARIAKLRAHIFDPDPKVSLVAIRMAMDLDGDKHATGTTYEQYLRTVMGRK